MKKIKNLLLFLFIFSINISAQEKPNIIFITVDDVGYFDLSCYHRGLATYQTPNIDRIAKDGLMITDYYAHPSCTAGRAAIITGQYPIRTGLTSVGQPGQKIGLQKEDPTLAEMLRPHGYQTALFGKWHLGDRNEYLPTVHGFDEFYGMLYHLNIMEHFEQAEFPKKPNYPAIPRNVIRSYATDVNDATEEKRWGKVGMQRIEDQGPLGAERMEDIDEEFGAAAMEWMENAHQKGDPFFLWFCPTRMHQKTHVSKKWRGQSGHSEYADGLMQLDWVIGEILNKVEKLGIKENTIITFTSDNGVNMSHWPDAGTAGFRGEKGLTWDGGFRVPMLVQWPKRIKAGAFTGEFMTSEDWVPTIMAAIGDMEIKERFKKEKKIHLDGYNQLEMLTENKPSKRHEFFYYAENELLAFRVNQWKIHTSIKDEWLKKPTGLNGGLLINIKLDPFERSPGSAGHFLWMKEKTYILPQFVPYLKKYGKSMQEFPPRQTGAGLGINALMGNKK